MSAIHMMMPQGFMTVTGRAIDTWSGANINGRGIVKAVPLFFSLIWHGHFWYHAPFGHHDPFGYHAPFVYLVPSVIMFPIVIISSDITLPLGIMISSDITLPSVWYMMLDMHSSGNTCNALIGISCNGLCCEWMNAFPSSEWHERFHCRFKRLRDRERPM